MTCYDLLDADTTEFIRIANTDEIEASLDAASNNPYTGIILVDGRRCYVQEI